MNISLAQYDHSVEGAINGPPTEDIDMERVLNKAQALFDELSGGDAYEVRFHMADGETHRFPVKTPMVSGGSVTVIDQGEGFTATTAEELLYELPAQDIVELEFLQPNHPHYIIEDDPFFPEKTRDKDA